MTPYDDRGHTLDVVRILLSYAVNPKHLCGEEISCIKEHVQKSARHLLLELVQLSDTAIDPSVPKPAVKPFIPKEPSQKATGKGDRAANVEMKRGYWLCPK